MENKKINILFVESTSGYGRSAKCLQMILDHLDRSVFQSFVALRDKGSQLARLEGIEIIYLKNYSTAKYNFSYLCNFITEVSRLYFFIKKNKINLVHNNTNIMLGMPAFVASTLARVKCITHIRETRDLVKRETMIVPLINKILVLNNAGYKRYNKFIPKEKLIIYSDSIEINEFSNIENGKFRKEYNLQNMHLVGLVGRIVEGKGQKEFVLAAQKVLQLRKDVKFLIIGSAKGDTDDYYLGLKNLVLEKKLEDGVIFTGWRNDVNNIIIDLDILVQATTTFPEGSGLTMVEAMALGKAVIASDIPGPSEIVINEQTGYLIPPGDIQKLTDKILYLMDNPSLKEQMGKNGRKIAIEKYDIVKEIKQLEKIYLNVMNH